MKELYPISNLFIAQLGTYDRKNNLFVPYPKYFLAYDIISKREDGIGEKFNAKTFYEYACCDEKSTREKINSSILVWGNLKSLYPYLNAKERCNEVVTYDRLYEIYHKINNVKFPEKEHTLKLTNK